MMLFLRNLLILCLLAPAHVLAQAEIRDSSLPAPAPAPAPALLPPVEPEPSANPSIYDLQDLQQEVLELRGLLEQQAHEIKRLKQQRLDDYLDLDKRLSELSGSSPKSTSTLASNSSAPVPSLPNALTSTNDNSEQANGLYKEAINQLLNQQDYAGADKKFSRYLTLYPNGQYVPNVYYWQGQILFVSAKKDQAANTFKKLINDYPNHTKVPDAKFKLAKIYFEQGNKTQAKVLLDEVAASNSDAALLAKAFINKNY